MTLEKKEAFRIWSQRNWEMVLVRKSRARVRDFNRRDFRSVKVDDVGRSCIKCTRLLRRDNFVSDVSYRDGLHPYCRECKRSYRRKNWIGTLIDNSRTAAKKTHGRNRPGKREHTITTEDIRHQYNKQNGRCFYFGIPMDPTNSDPLNYRKVSLDRLDSDKGYTPDNIVLCTEAANKCKSRMSVAEFMQLQEDISRHYHNAPVHTLWFDPARTLPTPPESEPPPDPLTGDQS